MEYDITGAWDNFAGLFPGPGSISDTAGKRKSGVYGEAMQKFRTVRIHIHQTRKEQNNV